MTAHSCEDVAEMLVDYADGELPEAESAEIAGHVACCDRCRERLEAVQRSLELARLIWEASEAAMADATPLVVANERQERTAGHWWRVAPLAAAAALLIAVGILQYPNLEHVPPTTKSIDMATPAEIEYEIARAAVASQLLTAADLLAEQAGGEEYACERYRYIVAAYANSPAALESWNRLQSFCNERVEQ